MPPAAARLQAAGAGASGDEDYTAPLMDILHTVPDEDGDEDDDEDCTAPMDSLHTVGDEDGDEDDGEGYTAHMDFLPAEPCRQSPQAMLEDVDAWEDSPQDSELEEDEENGSGGPETRSATTAMLSRLRPRGFPSRDLFRFTRWGSLQCTLCSPCSFVHVCVR